MRICKDCKHLKGRPHLGSQFAAKCALSQHIVSGEPLEAYTARSDESMCGKGAKWFEPIEEDWREPRDEDGYRKPE